MNLLLYREIRPEIEIPAFGEAFIARLKRKNNPDVYITSLNAWALLAEGLRILDKAKLPEAAFDKNGKPYFPDFPLHFSLTHSGNMAAVLISDAPCGIDLEQIRPDIAGKLRSRVLSEEELSQNADFFSVWTKKEAAGKLSGKGLPARPCEMDPSEYKHLNCLQKIIADASGQEYRLCALCISSEPIKITDCV